MKSIQAAFCYLFLALLLATCVSKKSELVEIKSAPFIDSEIAWYRHPLRIVQIVLREPDAEDYQVSDLIDYLKKSSANVLVINGGGIVDFFQNPLPAANINKFLGSRDLLGEIVEACHTQDIRVIARIDFRGVEEHIYDQFPGWFARDQNGNPKMLTYTRPELYSACYNGYYRTEHALEFIDYLMANYDVDGIWHNSIAVQGICYCQTCQRLYRLERDAELPIPGDNSADDLKRYMRWKSHKADQHMGKMKEAVKAFGADKVYTAEVFGMFDTEPLIYSGIDLYNAKEHFDFLVSVAFLRPNAEGFEYEDLGYASSITKFLKSLDPRKESIILWGGNGTAHRYVMEPPVDSRVWLHEALSSGGRFWNCSFTGQNPASTYDRRNAYLTSDIYQFVRDNQDWLMGQVPLGEVGIFYSNLSRVNYEVYREADEHFGIPTMGLEQVLRENHYQYSFIPDLELSPAQLERFKVVALPNVALMTDAQIEMITDWVAKGGKLLASYQTSLFDENGQKRPDFGLSHLFGCSYTGSKVDTNKDCYQRISQFGELTDGFEETQLIVNAGNTLLVTASISDNTKVICNYVPRVHNQPPEKAWIEGMDSPYATMLLTRYGRGEVIYFSNQPDRYAHEGGHKDFRNILNNAIRYLLGTRMVESNAPESVHISLTKSSDRPLYILSLVNLTSAPVRPLRTLIPIRDIWVNLDIPNMKLDGFRVLQSDGEIAILTDRGIQVKLEELNEYASIALSMR